MYAQADSMSEWQVRKTRETIRDCLKRDLLSSDLVCEWRYYIELPHEAQHRNHLVVKQTEVVKLARLVHVNNHIHSPC